jgi:hypothetical protein
MITKVPRSKQVLRRIPLKGSKNRKLRHASDIPLRVPPTVLPVLVAFDVGAETIIATFTAAAFVIATLAVEREQTGKIAGADSASPVT